MTLSILIPASNEAALIGACLDALLASGDPGRPVEVIVIANGCTDATAQAARDRTAAALARGWTLRVIDLAQGGKPGALNAGDAAATGAMRMYLDADVTVSPPLLAQVAAVLDRDAPAYASGRVRIAGGGSAVSRAYAATWARVPFMARGVPGCGLFAVNAAGRARWGEFPPIISDDTFARLQFAAVERHAVPAPYDWPIAQGFGPLVRVRRRQDAGVLEIAQRYPLALVNDDKARLGPSGAARLALGGPVGFAVYAAVALAVRLGRQGPDWSRGR